MRQTFGRHGEQPGEPDLRGCRAFSSASARTVGSSVTLGMPGKAEPSGKYGTYAMPCSRH